MAVSDMIEAAGLRQIRGADQASDFIFTNINIYTNIIQQQDQCITAVIYALMMLHPPTIPFYREHQVPLR